jgi:putative oxidoreductase
MSVVEVQVVPRWRQIGLWIVKVLLALAFLAAGGAKLFGVPAMVQVFEQVGLGQWFRYLTGTLEVIGAVMVLIPATAAIGGALLAAIMVGATLAHLTVLPSSPLPAIVLFALSSLVVLAHRSQIATLVRALLGNRD